MDHFLSSKNTLLFPPLTMYIFLRSTHINPKWTSYHGVQPEPSEVMFDLIFLTIMRELRGLKLKKPVHKDVACVFHVGALPLHCGLLWTEPDQAFAWILSNVSPGQEELWSVLRRVSPHIRFEANIAIWKQIYLSEIANWRVRFTYIRFEAN